MKPSTMIYANVLQSLLWEKNPFWLLVMDIYHKWRSVFRLKQNLQLNRERLDYYRARVERMENIVQQTENRQTGLHLNRMR